ncbi:MAG: T9SS type A sorting domain-containing protein [Candidatus Delongbacteria bacterium]
MTELRVKYFFLIQLLLIAALNSAGMKFDPFKAAENSTEKSIPDTLKVLALMVEFEADDLDYTTGTGKFGSGYPDTLHIDGLPHDRSYFEDQLEFVKNYFRKQSRGSVQVTYTVLDTTVSLDHPMWYYNPNNGSEVLLERLTEMYRASWNAVKDYAAVDFKDYNTFVIFHAGSGQEFNPGFDETPFDIPSVYLSETDLDTVRVEAQDGTLITNTIILPECEWQIYDGEWYHAGMGGISSLMFAHRLGIPNLYSSDDGKSCIGKFGLMDQGSANFSGMIPSGVSAWVKELKGWADVSVLTSPQDSVKIMSDSTICRIDLNSDEYLLMENRTPLNYTSTLKEIFGYDRDGRRIRFFYDEDGLEDYKVDAGFRTLVRIDDDDYDFGLPTGYDLDFGDQLTRSKGGILIWHIDKTRTTQYNIDNNSVNDDFENRGVYLEEADGSFDIGNDYWLLDNGYGTELGWFYDAFFSDNQYWLTYPNSSFNSVEFSSVSYPRSDTNEAIQTGIKLHKFSVIGREMTFSFSYEEEDRYFTTDPELTEEGLYSPCYLNGVTYHFFCGTDGEFKIFDADSLVYSGTFGTSVNSNFLPFTSGTNISVVTADSTGIHSVDISSGTAQTIPCGKVVSQPVAGIVPTAAGLINIEDSILPFTGTETYTEAKRLMVLTDDTGAAKYISGKNSDVLFGIDILSGIVSERPFDTDSTYFIETDGERNMNGMIAFSKSAVFDGNSQTLWNDIDNDGQPESVTAEGSILQLLNQHGVYENGFPLDTSLGSISKTFIFESSGKKYIAAVDSSSCYGTISSEGVYDKKNDRSMPDFGKNSGLLEADGYVYLYNFDGRILTYHRIGSGSISDYTDFGKRVIVISDTPGGPVQNTVSGSVYNWPNPARGDVTNFRFFLNEPAEVKIDIYDINGNLVERLKKSFSASGEWFEIQWNVSSVPSGIYRAVLDFGSEKRKVKAAVIK